MPKQVLKIQDFSGGVNAYADPRDIKDNEFAQNWNAALDKYGVVRYTGGGKSEIIGLPHGNATFEPGYGLFSTSVDYTLSLIDGEFDNGFEQGTVAGYEETGTASITLATTSTHVSAANHATDDFYNNYTILIDSGNGIGQSRRITNYTGSTKNAELDVAFGTDPDTNSTYKIFKWVGDGNVFGNAGSTNYIDKSGSTFPYNDIASFKDEDRMFLRTKVESIGDNQSKPLGWVTYNPKTSATFTANDSDSTVIGNTTLKAGVKYTLSFFCKSGFRYYGYGSDGTENGSGTAYGEKVPFVHIYSDSVTNGTTAGLYLFESDSGPQFINGAESTYDFADNIIHNYIDNGNFEEAFGGGTAPAQWTRTGDSATDIVYSYESSSNQFGGEGNSLNMAPDGDFTYVAGVPESYIYQDVTLHDNQWYELFFAYSSGAGGIAYAIIDQDGSQNPYIVPWTSLEDTASLNNWKYIGQNASKTKVKPCRFFVPENSGTAKTIRVCFSGISASSNVRLDAVCLTKSFPDLVSMSNATGVGNPYTNEMVNWTRYQTSFTIPSEFDDANDWVININAGAYGHQNGADNTSDSNALYFGQIRLEAEESDTLTFLNDNSATESKVMIYSENTENWIANDLKWTSPNMKPVYNYVNGMLKISDANFASGNKSKLFYYLNRNKIDSSNNVRGWQIREHPLSLPPNIIASAAGDANEIGETFDAIWYCENYTFADKYQQFGHSTGGSLTTETSNWPMDELRSKESADAKNYGRIMFYNQYGDYDGSNPEENMLYWGDGTGTPSEGTASGEYMGLPWANHNTTGEWGEYMTSSHSDFTIKFGLPYNTNETPLKFYLAWAGNDGTSNDMASKMASYTTGNVSKISFSFTFHFQSHNKDVSNSSGNSGAGTTSVTKHGNLNNHYPPYFKVSAGKASGLFGGSTISSANQNKLGMANSEVTLMSKKEEAQFYNDDGDPIDFTSAENVALTKWADNEWWSFDEVETFDNGGHASRASGSKQFTGEITFDEDIAITDDMIMEFKLMTPDRNGNNFYNFLIAHCGLYNENDYDFPRVARVRFDSIDVYFTNSNWTAAADGVTQANSNDTKVNFKFGTPTEETAVGWEDRMFKLGVTSVNVFNEESNIRSASSLIGMNESAGVDNNQSAIAAGQCPYVTIYVGEKVAKDNYRKQLKYYMKDNDSDIWYLQFYVDLDTNKAYSTTSNYSTVGIYNSNTHSYSYTIPREHMLNYNEMDSYEAETFVAQSIGEKSPNELVCDYKTGVVANNRLYVGNIRQNGKIYGDRMIKSPIGKYNILPSSNFVDVAINDGDEITALQYFKDRLLQFKKNKVFVINVSGDLEFIENTFDNVGISKPCQVTKTPYGIAWANSSGCYLYDGEQMINLIEGKIGTETYQAAYTSNNWTITDTQFPAIGYIKSTKKLIVSYTTSSHSIANSKPTIFQYDFTSKGWLFSAKSSVSDSSTTSGIIYSNFINNSEGDILYYVATNAINAIYKWDDSPTAHSSNQDKFLLKTKDFDFGNPAVRKKIYKVYVTYKTGNDSTNSNILVKHATNGGTTFTAFNDSSTNYAAATGLAASAQWATAILTPTSSINNVYSFQLEFSGTDVDIPKDFEINDISIVYREKPVK